ncbi:hypothetical protein A1Q1_05019 [Trichosporon asahii var. asahii CBS 2479]|uniref:Uncharacterized protein n=1 Tax=Trichosporon asahii var. asahii (strain ATCC 90039 / CBS 2479 / JCM 2466 / KCTC 7840 / NBRC 103889/ NCYC 2677 / UAMH 7654) TaxID=1186058 RepID=J6EUA8_TRIAS|nr:hypothetical protein A1Q1_05019 [Trichosporon asahii var. asahii CBS 2479]EJT46372.1 hypothetical protein A1Q1_05019 [Trichosporon asahii var. asahii CBS 2479]
MMEAPSISKSASPHSSQEVVGNESRPRSDPRRSVTPRDRGRGRGSGPARSANGRFMRATPVETESMVDLGSVSVILGPSSPAGSVAVSAETTNSAGPPQQPGSGTSTVVTAAGRSLPVCQTPAATPKDEPLSFPPSIPSTPKQNGTGNHDLRVTPKVADASRLSLTEHSTATPTHDLAGPSFVAPGASPYEAVTTEVASGSKTTTPLPDPKGKQKRQLGSLSTPSSPGNQDTPSRPQRKKAVRRQETLGPINSAQEAPAGPSTAPVQPCQFFGSATPAAAFGSGENVAGAFQKSSTFPYPALPASTPVIAPPAAGPSSGQLEPAKFADAQNPLLALTPPAHGQRVQDSGLTLDQKQTLRYMIWGQPLGLPPPSNHAGIGDVNAPFTAPAMVGAGTFAQQQASPPVLGHHAARTGVIAQFSATTSPTSSYGPATTTTYQDAMPLTAFPILQGQALPQWQHPPLYGTHYLPSYDEMVNNPAMLSNPNLAPWTTFAAHHANRGQNQDSYPNALGLNLSGNGMVSASSSISNPQPAFQHYGAQPNQNDHNLNGFNILEDPDVKAVIDYVDNLAAGNLDSFNPPAGTDDHTQQAEGTQPNSTEVEAQ